MYKYEVQDSTEGQKCWLTWCWELPDVRGRNPNINLLKEKKMYSLNCWALSSVLVLLYSPWLCINSNGCIGNCFLNLSTVSRVSYLCWLFILWGYSEFWGRLNCFLGDICKVINLNLRLNPKFIWFLRKFYFIQS